MSTTPNTIHAHRPGPTTNQTYSYRPWLHQRPAPPLIEPTVTEPDYTKDVSHIGQCTSRCATQANRKTYIFKLHTDTAIYQTLFTFKTHRPHNPPEYIALINNSQMTQITYTVLYKHVKLLCSDSLQLCIYMTSSHMLPPNAWKCYQDYCPSRPIH